MRAWKEFENRKPEVVFHWRDTETEAEGWAVINSLRGGAAGGGTRMRAGLTLHEVESLAKTMEIKFSVCGPQIGGAKSGINFDPSDPRKEGVLRRWFTAVLPLLKNYYGTGGDLNVDEIREVGPITRELGLLHCQEGVVTGHCGADSEKKRRILKRLQDGVSKKISSPEFSPDLKSGLTIADMITGWGVSQAVLSWYRQTGKSHEGKRAIIQGFGNVGGAAAWFLAKSGVKVTGIIDRDSGLISESGFGLAAITEFLLSRKGNSLSAPGEISFGECNEKIWNAGAEIFLPCARSRIVTASQLDRMIGSGLEIISSGANVPFDDPEIFLGKTGIYADQKIACIPDFIANCGMARAFAYFMEDKGELTDEAIFADVTHTIDNAIGDIIRAGNGKVNLWQTGLAIAMGKLEGSRPEQVYS